MSTLKVANIHFETTGTNRIEYLGSDNIIRANSGAFRLPTGDTAARPTGESGLIRYNTQTGVFEAYYASSWGTVGDPTPAFVTANAAYAQANAAYDTANNAASTGKAIAMAIVFG